MHSEMIRQVEHNRSATWEKAKAHLDTVEARGGTLTGEDEATYRAITAELDQYDARLDQLRTAQERSVAAAAASREFGGRPVDSGAGDDLARQFLTGERRTMEVDLRQVSTHVGHNGERETRDLMVGSGTGGKTVPSSFRAQLVEHMVQMSGIRQTNATILSTDGGEELAIPATTTLSTAALIDEGDPIGSSDPTFSSVKLNAYKYAVMLQASRELVMDSGIDLSGYLARETGMALGIKSGSHYIVGTGSGQPNGVVTAASTGVTGATSVGGAFTADDLIETFYSVIPAYRANGFFMMNDATAAAVRKLKDPSGDHYVWEQSLAAETPNMLFGRPVVIDPNIPDIGVGNKSLIFGDLSRYFIRDVKGIRFERSDDFAFGNDLVTWRAILRSDGDLVDTTGAVKAFVGGAS